MLVYKKGREKDPRNPDPHAFHPDLSALKHTEQIILSAITWHVQGNQAIRPSQHRFMKSWSCLTNLISFN